MMSLGNRGMRNNSAPALIYNYNAVYYGNIVLSNFLWDQPAEDGFVRELSGQVFARWVMLLLTFAPHLAFLSTMLLVAFIDELSMK